MTRPIEFVLYSAMAPGVATVSWAVFERPINALERQSPYKVTGRPTAAGRLAVGNETSLPVP